MSRFLSDGRGSRDATFVGTGQGFTVTSTDFGRTGGVARLGFSVPALGGRLGANVEGDFAKDAKDYGAHTCYAVTVDPTAISTATTTSTETATTTEIATTTTGVPTTPSPAPPPPSGPSPPWSWWNGSNVPGKKAQNMTYIQGIQSYEAECRETLDGWKGFEVV